MNCLFSFLLLQISNSMKKLILIPVLLITFISCSTEEQPLTDYPNSDLLLSAEELNNMMQTEEIFLIDARGEAPDSLIAGAMHFASISELTDPDHPIAGYLVGPDTFQQKMRNIGLNNDHKVVIYDDGNSLSSARLFYALDYYGFSNASILNGGIQAWVAEGLELTNSPVENNEGNFSLSVDETLTCDISYVMEASSDPNKIIFDTRSEDEYSGVDKRTERTGHIPNAVNLEWNKVLQPEGIPYFLSAQEIQNQYTALGITPEKEIIPHCQTNVRGSHAYFTLRLMGYDSVRPYEGSWSEYGNDPNSIIQ